MNSCGHCKNYYMGNDLESRCRLTGRVVGYLQEKECYEPLTNSNMETKICKRCGRELPLDNFGKHFRAKDGHQAICRDCMSAEMKKVKASGKEDKEEKEEPSPEPVSLRDILDDDLFSELRRRGYKGTLSHTVTL